MANDRMFLVHKPSMVAVCLGTRLGGKWQTKNYLSKRINNLFNHKNVGLAHDMDEFAIEGEERHNRMMEYKII